MAIDANGLQQALSVILESREKEAASRHDSENQVSHFRKRQHQRARRKKTERLNVKHATQYPGFDQKDHTRDDCNHRR